MITARIVQNVVAFRRYTFTAVSRSSPTDSGRRPVVPIAPEVICCPLRSCWRGNHTRSYGGLLKGGSSHYQISVRPRRKRRIILSVLPPSTNSAMYHLQAFNSPPTT